MPRKTLTLEAINARLKASRCRLRVEQRGGTLWLRGTLPLRLGATDEQGRDRKQQRFALHIYANPAGLAEAEAEAQRYGALLEQGRFSWADTPGRWSREQSNSCAEWVERFRADWAQKRSESAEKQRHYWMIQFQWLFDALPQQEPLSEAVLRTTARRWKDKPRAMQMACQKFERLARFAGVTASLDDLRVSYRPRSRNIPTEAEIVAAIDGIPYRPWQWAFGAMMTFGLRNHEIVLSEYERSADGLLVALVPEETKTGQRVVLPLRLEWCDRWRLDEVDKPRITGRTNAELGSRVTTAARRYQLGFTPYNLRHAWNIIAALEFGLDPGLVGQFAGNSARVNSETYRKHISEARAREAWVQRLRGN